MSDWKLCDFKEKSHFWVLMRQRERKSFVERLLTGRKYDDDVLGH